jgi:Fe-S-cluster-containing hydrogenase component 2
MRKKIRSIIVKPILCVECLCCQLACSLKKYGTFNPDQAFIRIESLKEKIAFTEDCDQCGYCASFCMYGALEMDHSEK